MIPATRPTRHMKMLINFNGELLDPGEAKISVLDHGFLFGDSVYDVIGTVNGRLFTAEEHLERLRNSAAAIRLDIPLTNEEFIHEMNRTLAAAGNAESYIRIVITRGEGVIDLHPRTCKKPNWMMFVMPLHDWPAEWYTDGIKVALVSIHRNPSTALSPKIKSGNYLNNVIARMQAADEDAVEGIMLNPEGWVTEGTTSNIWMVKDGKAKTPALRCGLLPGVTRALVLELASTNGIPVEECEISREELLDAEEAFITSTTKGVVPIRLIGDTAVGNGKPGPITKRLGQLLTEREQAN